MNKPRLDQGPDYERGFVDGMQHQMQSNVDKAVNRMAQPEQEPIGYASEGAAERLTTVKQAHEQIRSFKLFTHDVPLYTAPQREFVGLTDEEIKAFDTWHDNREEEVGWCNPSEIVAYIEAKLKQKNGYAEEKNT